MALIKNCALAELLSLISGQAVPRDPPIIGRASFQDAQLDYVDLPFRFSALQADMVFSRNLVRLENIRGNTASGKLSCREFWNIRTALRSLNINISAATPACPIPKTFGPLLMRICS